MRDLASRAGISVSTIQRFENGSTNQLMWANGRAIIEAFDKAGIEFTPHGVQFKETVG